MGERGIQGSPMLIPQVKWRCNYNPYEQIILSVLGPFLKGNLTGQTSIRVDPSWASQTALLQGFSQMTLPDLLIREEELPDTLARLSERVPGVAMAQNLTHPSAPFALAEIYDATIETAVSNIYRRDYLNFGFDRWNKT